MPRFGPHQTNGRGKLASIIQYGGVFLGGILIGVLLGELNGRHLHINGGRVFWPEDVRAFACGFAKKHNFKETTLRDECARAFPTALAPVTSRRSSTATTVSSALSTPAPTPIPPFDGLKELQVLLKPYKILRPSVDKVNPSKTFRKGRRNKAQRKFTSTVVDQVVDEISRRIKDPDLAKLFANCFPNTLDTTVDHFDGNKPDAFIITGDIPAQWLRDSTNQVLPYVPFATSDVKLDRLICGLIRRQSADILTDPYANAFNFGVVQREKNSWQKDRRTPPMQPHVYEGKYELDSLNAMMKLSYRYFNYTRQVACFDHVWVHSVVMSLNTIEEQMKGTDEEGSKPPYRFQRNGRELPFQGRAAPAKRTGMSKCGFRPSDDGVQQPFLVPANAMAVVELRHVAEILDELVARNVKLWPIRKNRPLEAKPYKGYDYRKQVDLRALSQRARKMADGIDAALWKHAAVYDKAGKFLFMSYEVNGKGGRNNMDDANLPSLLSLPYLGYIDKTNSTYHRIRNYVWSPKNRWFFRGKAATGIGGPHIGMSMVWPMSIIMWALTSTKDAEIKQALEWLKASSAGTGFLHESFHKDNPQRFTRHWFAWVNTLFGELILSLIKERPHLLFK